MAFSCQKLFPPLTILSVKRGLLCNLAKTVIGCHFIGHNDTVLKFSATICKFSKLSQDSLLKIMSKVLILDLNKRAIFSS